MQDESKALRRAIECKRETYAVEVRKTLRQQALAQKRVQWSPKGNIDQRLIQKVGNGADAALIADLNSVLVALKTPWQESWAENLRNFLSTDQNLILRSSLALRRLMEDVDAHNLDELEAYGIDFAQSGGVHRCLFIIQNRGSAQVETLLYFNALVMIGSITLYYGEVWVSQFMALDGVNILRAVAGEKSEDSEFFELALISLGNALADRHDRQHKIRVLEDQHVQARIIDSLSGFLAQDKPYSQYEPTLDSIVWLLVNVLRRKDECVSALDARVGDLLQGVYKKLFASGGEDTGTALPHSEQVGEHILEVLVAITAHRVSSSVTPHALRDNVILTQKDVFECVRRCGTRRREAYALLKVLEQHAFFGHLGDALLDERNLQTLFEVAQHDKERALRVAAATILRCVAAERVLPVFSVFGNVQHVLNSLYERRSDAELKVYLQLILTAANDHNDEYFAALISHGLVQAVFNALQAYEQHPECAVICLMIVQRVLDVSAEQHACTLYQRVADAGYMPLLHEIAQTTRKGLDKASAKAVQVLEEHFQCEDVH